MSEMIGMFLVSFFGALLGAFTAIAVFRWYQKMQQLKILLELHKELNMRIDTEMNFAKLAQQLRDEGIGNE
jgi:preprotein translocase subunit Sec63